MDQKLIFTELVGEAIDDLVADLGNPDAVVVADVNTAQFVMPLLRNDSKTVAGAPLITLKAGDTNKSLEQLTDMWRSLGELEATPSTLIINVGGGVVSDLGGFAAATFKRGLRFINVPTSVLGAVDASIGGKTGINFNGLKNQLGTFTEPVAAIISTIYFNTLTEQEILSGYAEMLKHGILEDSGTFGKLLTFSPVYPTFNSEAMMPLLQASVLTKKRIVEQDLRESGLRKVLNFGHTIGHAFEALGRQRRQPVAHGYAVAWGMVAETVLSNMKEGFSTDDIHRLADYVHTNYGAYDITCDDYPALIAAMRQDKKNRTADNINFTLLKAVGQPVIDCVATPKEIESALDIYRDLMKI